MEEKNELTDLQNLEELKQQLEAETQAEQDVDEEFSSLLDSFLRDEIEEVSRKTFEESIAFLDEMVGMEAIKEKLLRLGRYVQWKKRMKAGGCDVSHLPVPNLTFMFLGDPGTGKTTLAQQMGEILYSLDLISDNHVYLYRREDLVGQNYGYEEQATKEALEASKNGVFVLDEAYQCFKGATDKRDPAYHILETLMPAFGEPGRCIILAGYKKEMLELMQVNSGFRSRIPEENLFEFAGPSEQTLIEIVERRLEKMEMRLSTKAARMLRDSIHEQFARKDRSFGNARQMRQMTDSMVIAHANRIMTTLPEYDYRIINSADMATCLSAQVLHKPATRSQIGFA